MLTSNAIPPPSYPLSRRIFLPCSSLQLFKPMLHIILLIWKNSKHYNTPARLVVLMREICNSLIIQACKYSSGEQIFSLIEQEDAAKAVDQLKTTLLVCGTFKSTYFDYKATANAECPANPWRIQVGTVVYVACIPSCATDEILTRSLKFVTIWYWNHTMYHNCLVLRASFYRLFSFTSLLTSLCSRLFVSFHGAFPPTS